MIKINKTNLLVFFLFIFFYANFSFSKHDTFEKVDINDLKWKLSAQTPGYDNREIGHFFYKNINKTVKLINDNDLLITKDFYKVFIKSSSIHTAAHDQEFYFQILLNDYGIFDNRGSLLIDDCVFTKFFYEQYPEIYVRHLLFEYQICIKN